MTPLILLAAAVFVALSVLDLTQSLKLQKLGAVENNPLLGKHPSPKKLTIFAVVSTALWLGAGLWLASAGAPGVLAVLALGCFLRLFVVVKGRKLLKEMEKRNDRPRRNPCAGI